MKDVNLVQKQKLESGIEISWDQVLQRAELGLGKVVGKRYIALTW